MSPQLQPNMFPKSDPQEALRFFRTKLQFTTGPMEVSVGLEKGAEFTVIDVRQPEDYAEGHVPGSINLPEERWATLAGLSRDRLNIVYCYSHVCHLGARGAAHFAEQGFSTMEMEGGFDAWEQHELPIEKGAKPKSRAK